MQQYIYEGRPERAGAVEELLVSGTVLAVGTLAATLLTVLAVAAAFQVTEGVDPLVRLLVIFCAFALGAGLATAVGNVALPDPVRKWARPSAAGGS